MLASKIEKRLHCVKSVRVRSFSGPYFLAFGLNTEIYSARMGGGGNTDQNNSEYVRSLFSNFLSLYATKCYLLKEFLPISNNI